MAKKIINENLQFPKAEPLTYADLLMLAPQILKLLNIVHRRSKRCLFKNGGRTRYGSLKFKLLN